MLTVAKNQIKVTFLSIKYAIMREMVNKVSFIMNVLFMILNNASFIIQWAILISIKHSVGGYNLKQILLIWGFAASSFGLSRFLFKNAFDLPRVINEGKLDAYLVQPKNVLLSVITSDVSSSALGDILYGYIMLFIYGVSISRFFLFTLFTICGAIIVTCISIILSSLSFWFSNTDMISETGNNLMTSFSTYPDSIFKGIVKIMLYTIIPVGICVYIPFKVLMKFNLYLTIVVILFSIMIIIVAFLVFYNGLRRYSSSSLMSARL